MKRQTQIIASIGLWCGAAAGLVHTAQAESYSFTTFLGPGGLSDGLASRARFDAFAIAVDAAGNVYVSGDRTVRKITQLGTNWVVGTLAGQMDTAGTADGIGSQARLGWGPTLGVDSHGNVYLNEVRESTTVFRRITPLGTVTTLASFPYRGQVLPAGVGIDTADNVYMPSWTGDWQYMREISPAGGVVTLWPTSLDFEIGGIVFDPSGNMYLASPNFSVIRQVTPDGTQSIFAGQSEVPGTADGTVSDALFSDPYGLAIDRAGTIYVGDHGYAGFPSAGNAIRRITPDGMVTTFAGQPTPLGVDGIDNPPAVDGVGSEARFAGINGLATDVLGNVYVADEVPYGSRGAVRKVTPDGAVTTVAGTPQTDWWFFVAGMAADHTGNLYVAGGYTNQIVSKISPDALVSTLAGQPGVYGYADGMGTNAQFGDPFENPTGLAIDAAGNLYMADRGNNAIRKITPSGLVSTLAGHADGSPGSADGTGSAASFHAPQAVAVDGAGSIYVADTANYTIRKITPEGSVTTLAGEAGLPGTANGTGSLARFSELGSLVVDGSTNVYVADYGTIRKVTPAGVVTTLAGRFGVYSTVDGAGSVALFNSPRDLAMDEVGGVIYVADGPTIRRVTTSGVVTTLAGHGADGGYVDGPADLARFDAEAIVLDGQGNLFAASLYVNNNSAGVIRKVVPTRSLPPVVLGKPILSNAQFGFWMSGLPGSTVAVETSSDMANWRLVGMYRLDGGTNLFVSPTPLGPNQYFRARP
jgi:hypothetical protein